MKKFNFLKYFKSHKLLVFAFLLTYIIGIFVDIFCVMYTAQILITITNTGDYVLGIWQLLIWFAVYTLGKLTQITRNIITQDLDKKVTNEMRTDIAMQAFKVSDKAYADHNTSNFIQRISADPSKILSTLVGIISLLSDIIAATITFVWITFLNVYIGLLLVLGLSLTLILEFDKQKRRKKEDGQNFIKAEKTSSLITEVIRSERDIKSLNLEHSLKDDIKKSLEESVTAQVKTQKKFYSLEQLYNVFFQIFSIGSLILGLVLMKHELFYVTSFMLVYENRSMFGVLRNSITHIGGYITDLSLSIERINELYEDNEYALERFGDVHVDNLVGEIEFKDVSFSYISYKDRDKDAILKEKKQSKKKKIKADVPKREIKSIKKVFDSLSFNIKQNTTVAFVGVSGSGKSTILNLIAKIYENDSGEILLGGHDIKSLDKDTIRSSIALVNQFPYIFNMSIKENLLLAKPDASDEEVNKALKDSALDEFVNGLNDGIETIVGESGVKLSGGQKQRLAIARALLKKSSIILFDESTSSLDNLAQNQIKKSIDNIKGQSTIVIVAHRLSTIKNVDKIFFLEDGKITGVGTFEELYENNENFKDIFLAENIE